MADKKALFDKIKTDVETILAGPGDTLTRLQAVCDLLCDRIDYYDWVGFYLVGRKKGFLELGPFHGSPTDHVCIPFGKGVCGQAAAKKRTIIIQDVARETNYLACSPSVKAEIVIPVFKSGEVTGELDIDSHQISPFTWEDRELLETICISLEKIM